MSVGVFAQTTTTTDTSAQALSPQDAAKAKAELENLAQAFGIKPPSTNGTTATSTSAEQHKTIGDVGDKALDMVGKAVASISSTLEKVAPHVWKIMIRQQYAKAIGDLIVPWGLLFLVLLYWLILRKMWQPGSSEGDEEWWARFWVVRFLPGLFSFIFAWWGFVRLSDSVMMLLNPEYYAVKDIITMLLGQAPQ